MLRSLVFSFLIPVCLLVMPVVGHGEGLPDYQVKAAFIYNFAKFVELPNELFESPETPLKVCLLGKHRNAATFASLRGKDVKGRKVEVREIAGIESLGGCHVLFISRSEEAHIDEILSQVPEGVLTVGESEGFVADGGIINFVVVDKRVRFDINQQQARKVGISISSHLLRLAHQVKD